MILSSVSLKHCMQKLTLSCKCYLIYVKTHQRTVDCTFEFMLNEQKNES